MKNQPSGKNKAARIEEEYQIFLGKLNLLIAKQRQAIVEYQNKLKESKLAQIKKHLNERK